MFVVHGSNTCPNTLTTLVLDYCLYKRYSAARAFSDADSPSAGAHIVNLEIFGVREPNGDGYRALEAAFGPIPALYVRADVCRDELPAELEGVASTIGPRVSQAPATARSLDA